MVFFEKLEIEVPELNNNQLKKLSDIASDLGLVSISSVALPAVFSKSNPFAIAAGIILAAIFWIYSIWLRR
ncbi:MAG TPA: hypothetical protein VLF89_03675 [Candidatus Saccharimonadales bacterium]|nr:hypothetical protein [Candidatus Saccharimonadales bacterium]